MKHYGVQFKPLSFREINYNFTKTAMYSTSKCSILLCKQRILIYFLGITTLGVGNTLRGSLKHTSLNPYFLGITTLGTTWVTPKSRAGRVLILIFLE